ncbi:hypothetical protein N7481_000772 [Penicillium waksmanii]|uniref:uncharacterized protein n=1 Tax=Penicillium waksmanii TaxID=69791 RepID=UPI002548E4F9|nr:uncharacterized protein N7481_000772 [Penicillium waksmanii]KAJ6000363.1 hypothetical protein N7481_000772 [Penicillium waksmanii]
MESRVDGHHLRHRPRVGNAGGEEAGPQSTGCQEQDRNSISGTQADTRVAEREISEDGRERESERKGREKGEEKGCDKAEKEEEKGCDKAEKEEEVRVKNGDWAGGE